jgi:hypothetical protein
MNPRPQQQSCYTGTRVVAIASDRGRGTLMRAIAQQNRLEILTALHNGVHDLARQIQEAPDALRQHPLCPAG